CRLLGMSVVSLYWVRSSSCPLELTTRSSAPVLALAPAGPSAASATSDAAAAIEPMILISEPPLPRGSCWLAGDRSPGFRAMTSPPSQRVEDSPVADCVVRMTRSQWRDRAGFSPDFP